MSQQLALVLAATLTVWVIVARGAPAHAADLTVPAEAPVEHVDFTPPSLEGWHVMAGQWTVEEMRGAPSGKPVLVQRAVEHFLGFGQDACLCLIRHKHAS